MIKNNWKTLMITGLIILLPFVWGFITYASLPEQIPIHFDLTGSVNSYGPKWVVLLISPIALLIQWIAAFDAQIKSKKEDLKETYIRNVSWSMAALTIALSVVIYNCAIGNLITAHRLCPVIIGAIFIITGNLMPKQKKNRWSGIRIKWTLEDPDNWFKTHRLFGKVSVIGGFVMIPLSLINNVSVIYAITFSILLCIILIPTIYSYTLHKKKVATNGTH